MRHSKRGARSTVLCGTKLDLNTNPHGKERATCEKCGRKFEKSGYIVIELNP